MKKVAISLLAAAGLLAGCNQRIESASEKFNSLPPAVQKTARAQAPNAEIADVSDLSTNGMKAYKIEFRQGNSSPTVIVADNGTLMATDFPKQAGVLDRLLTPTGATATPLSALPLAAQKAIQAHAPPNAQIDKINRHEENGRVIYEVQFKDQDKNPTLKVAADGTLVQDLQK